MSEHREQIEIIINGKAYIVGTDDMTGAQIKALANIPPGDLLYQIIGDHRREVADTDRLELHQDEKFVSVPQVGGASVS